MNRSSFAQVLICLFISSTLYGQSGTLHSLGLFHQNLIRTYLLYVPADYTGQEEWPLVINYHGFGSTARTQMDLHSKMNTVADTGHFLIAYPHGLTVTDLVWGGTALGWNIPVTTQADQDDIAFTDVMINEIQDDYEVDTTRIYLTGFSAGAEMALWAGNKLKHRIAAVAGVGGYLNNALMDSVRNSGPFSLLLMVGTEDPFVSYENGKPPHYAAPSIYPSFWARHNDCSSDSLVTELPDVNLNDNCTVTRIDYTGCDDSAEVLFYRINNGGHTWPGGTSPTPGLGNNTFDINGSSEMWNFFKRNPYPDPTSGIADTDDNLPNKFQLHQNYPNPFNPMTTIRFGLSQSHTVSLAIYNLHGERVISLVDDEVRSAGEHKATWDGHDWAGRSAASGVYLVRLTAGDIVASRKVTLLR